MGYFSNGTEGMDYEERYCSTCLHRGPVNGPGCYVWFAHMLHPSDGIKTGSILNLLIPRSKDGLSNERCTMYLNDPTKGARRE